MSVLLFDWDEGFMDQKPMGEWGLDRVLVAIPAHNEEKHIAEVVAAAKDYGSAVLVLENGSTDRTAELARAAGAKVVCIIEKGYGRALREIFEYARMRDFDYLVTLDGDGQHDPSEIPLFITQLSRRFDVVIGNRFLKSVVPVHRLAVIAGFNAVFEVGDSQCGFRAYNYKAIRNIRITEDGMGASLQILSEVKRLGLSVCEVPVTIKYETAKPVLNQITQGMNLVETLFWSTVWVRPYTYLGVPAFLMFLLSLVSGLWAMNVYAAQRYLVPSAALICGVSFLGAVLLTSFAFYVTISRRIVKEMSVK